MVAASYHPGGGFRRGQTRVYQLVGNLWKQVDAPINGLIDSEYCGSKTAVSANGEMVVVTSPVSSLNVPSGGAVRVYEGGVLNTESFSSLNELNVYPIPAKENISIALGREYGEITVVQYDVLGKEMNRLKVVGKTKIDFPLKGNAGVYFLKISTENSSKTIKIVKQ